MTNNSKWLAALFMVAALAACGGGGGSGGAGGVQPLVLTEPPVTGAPTAVLTASQQTAVDLVAAAKAGAAAVEKVDGFSSLPLGVQVTPPAGVMTTTPIMCHGGGSAQLTQNSASSSTTTVGDSARVVFSGCVEQGFMTSGTVNLTLTRYVNDNNLTALFSAIDLVTNAGGMSRGPFSFTGQIDYNFGAITFSYGIDGVTVVGNGTLSRDGNSITIMAATTRNNLGSGFGEVRLTGWTFNRATGRPSTGTATWTGAAGNSATTTVANDGYHVSITINGVVTNFTVPF